MGVKDLWPELTPSNELTPLGILRKQASLLFRKTNGLLEGEVVTDGKGGVFLHRFNVVAPALGYFKHELFSIGHGLNSYPLTGTNSKGEQTAIKSEDELYGWIAAQIIDQKPALERLLNESMTDSMRAELVG